MLRDLRFAFHLLVKERWYSAVAIVALALGIGVNATVFTLVNAILIRGLPYKDSAAALHARVAAPERRLARRVGAGPPGLADPVEGVRRARPPSATAASTSATTDPRRRTRAAPASRPTSSRCSPCSPVIGRNFTPDDERTGAERVVIIGHAMWKSRYAEDRGILGKIASARRQAGDDHRRHAGGRCSFPSNTELWTPIVLTADQQKRDFRFLQVFGRLRPDVSRAQAQTELNGIAARLAGGLSRHEQGLPGRPRRDLQRAVQRRQHPDRDAGDDGGRRLRPAHRLRQRRQPAAVAVGASLARSGRPHRARRHALARGPPAAGRKRPARHPGRRARPRSRAGRRAALRRAPSPTPASRPGFMFTMDYTVFGFLAAICVADRRPVRPRARAAGDEDQRQRGAQGRRPRQRRRPARAMADGDDGRPRARADARAARRRGPDDPQLPEALHDRHRHPDGEPGVDAACSCRAASIPRRRRPARRPAVPPARPDPRIAFYDRLLPRLEAIAGVESVHVHDERASVRRRPPRHRHRGASGAEAGREGARGGHRHHQPEVLRRPSACSFGAAGCSTTPTARPDSETVIINEKLAASSSRTRIRSDAGSGSCRARRGAGQPPPPVPVWRTIVGISPTIRHSSPQDAEPPAVMYVPHRQNPPSGANDPRQEPSRRRRRDERRPHRGRRRRSGPADLHGADDGADARAADVAVPRLRQPVRDLRRDRAGDVGGRALRGHGVLGHAADDGDRRAHGARRRGPAGVVVDPEARAAGRWGSAWRWAWPARSA